MWLDHPSEFLQIVKSARRLAAPTWVPFLHYEGSRIFTHGIVVGEFNDFYAVGNQAEREIDRLLQTRNVRKYLLVKYEPLKVGRFDLGNKLGTIHRGTSIVVFY